jgi:RNase H-fold protein (predicted Holliday junction resolvase)
MFQESVTILAVNPGTKYLGLAVFQSTDLVYWGTRVLKGKWSQKKMGDAETTLRNLIDQYHVDILVLKKLHSSRSSRNLNCLVRSIEKLTKKKRVRLYLYSLSDLKEFLAEGMKANKMAIAGIVTARYPFLIHELEREKKHKHPYFVRMFEAIAAGIVAFNRMDRK